MKNTFGSLAYIAEGLRIKRLNSMKPYKVKVEYDGNVIEDEFIYGMICNSMSVGGFKGLGGKDVLRKLLILSREAGVPLEASDVEISPMLPPEFFDCGIDEFFAKLEAWVQNFLDLEDELDGKGMRQRFVATLRCDKTRPLGYRAEIKMQHVDPSDPFYWVTGTENVTVIRSEQSAPLIIRGAGEGTRLAASGIIRDLLQ